MQTRSFRGLGEPAWVNAPSSACVRLGPDPRRALGPAATPAASTGRTRDRTRPMLQERQKVLARAPSTRDPKRPIREADISQALSISSDLGVQSASSPPGKYRWFSVLYKHEQTSRNKTANFHVVEIAF